MKILFVSEYYPPIVMGGGEINLSIIASALVDKKINVTVLTSFQPGLKKQEQVNGVKIYRYLLTGKNPLSLFENLKRSLWFTNSIIKQAVLLHKQQKFDIIHFIGSSIMAAKILTKLNVPLVATIESYPALCPKGDRMFNGQKECNLICSFKKFKSCQSHSSEVGKMRNHWYIKYNWFVLKYIYHHYKELNSSLRHCHLIAISVYLQNLLKAHDLESKVIPNAINIKQIDLSLSRKLYPKSRVKPSLDVPPFHKSSSENKLKILFLGSLTKFKGPQVLLKAAIGLNCKIDFYGEGPLKNKLQGMINKYNLDAKIHLPVSYTEINSVYLQADLVVFPSLWPEPFGRIPLEALALKKPLLASKIGAVPEVIPNLKELTFRPGDYEELRNKINQFINCKNYAGKIDYKTFKNKFSEKSVARQLISFYFGILP